MWHPSGHSPRLKWQIPLVLLLVLVLSLLLQGCLGLDRTSPVIPNREQPHELAQGVWAHVYVASGTDATGKTTYVDQSYYIPAGFVVFAPELIHPAPTGTAP